MKAMKDMTDAELAIAARNCRGAYNPYESELQDREWANRPVRKTAGAPVTVEQWEAHGVI